MSNREVFFRATRGEVHGKATGQGGGGTRLDVRMVYILKTKQRYI